MPAEFSALASAFSFLSPSRAIGFSAIGCIPLAEIIAYHEIFPLGYAREDFVELIRLIDLRYVELANKPQDGPRKNTRSND